MATRIQIRRDTAANWTSENPTLSVGEFGYETDTSKLKIGDGSTAWTSLSYFVDPNSTLSLNDITDVAASSATTGQVLTAQSDGSFSFADSGGDTIYQNTFVFTASSGQTSFSGPDDNGYQLTFTSGQTMVFLNGVLLVENVDYNENSTTNITLTQAAEAEDILLISTWETSEPEIIYTFQGSNYGYSSGKVFDSSIDKFPFSSDANATDVGDLSVGRNRTAGQSSVSHGYTSGGQTPVTNVIDKFAFTADGQATDVGDLTVSRFDLAGQSVEDYGYAAGGWRQPGYSDVVDRFPFASDASATDIGNVSIVRFGSVGQSSADYGYVSGGSQPGYPYGGTRVYKFPFSSSFSYTSTVGELTVARYTSAGQSSSDYGYTSGGNPTSNVIDKFPFASDANASDVGNLTVSRYQLSGQSSSDYGYSSGGRGPGSPYYNTIDKFPFASNANAADVGDLTVARDGPAGQQY